MTPTTGMKSKTGGIDPTRNIPNPNPPTPRNFCHDKLLSQNWKCSVKITFSCYWKSESTKNIAKGTTDPRVHIASWSNSSKRILTKIMPQIFDQNSVSNSRPNFSLDMSAKQVLNKIQPRILDQNFASKSRPISEVSLISCVLLK